jgi:hypothetical protein
LHRRHQKTYRKKGNPKRKKTEAKQTGFSDEFAEEIIDVSDEEFQLKKQVEDEFLEYSLYERNKSDEVCLAEFWNSGL